MPQPTDGGPRADRGTLRRSRTDRHLAGVAGGIGRYLGVDSDVVRLVLVGLVFAGFAGPLIYLATYILVPEDGDDRTVLQRGIAGEHWPLIVLLGGALALVGGLDSGGRAFGDVGAWLPILLIGGGVYVLYQGRERNRADDTGAGDAPTAAPGPDSDVTPGAGHEASTTTTTVDHTAPASPGPAPGSDASAASAVTPNAVTPNAVTPNASPAPNDATSNDADPSTVSPPGGTPRGADPAAAPAPVDPRTPRTPDRAVPAAASAPVVPPQVPATPPTPGPRGPLPPRPPVPPVPHWRWWDGGQSPSQPAHAHAYEIALRTTPREPRRRSILTPIVLSALAVLVGVATLTERWDLASPDRAVWWATALAIVAVGMLVSAWTGRARGLLTLAILLSIGLVVETAASPDFRIIFSGGERQYSPAALAEGTTSYELGVGDLQIDLSDTDLGDGGRTVEAELQAGEMTVIVPADAVVAVTANATAGELTVFGEATSGFGVDAVVDADDPSGAGGTDAAPDPDLVLDLDVSLGTIVVERDTGDGPDTTDDATTDDDTTEDGTGEPGADRGDTSEVTTPRSESSVPPATSTPSGAPATTAGAS